MTILNLTQHTPTPDQVLAGVVEPADKAEVKRLLTFAAVPAKAEVYERSLALAEIARASGADEAMIGGALWLMGPLEHALRCVGVTPLYSFTERRSTEEVLPDGSVMKAGTFKHLGWVEGLG